MARHTGPKWKLSRREGIDLFYRPGSKYQRDARINQPPGVHGPKQYRSKSSDYNLQLREKQKAKRIYGVLEKQFKRYYQKAAKTKENTPLVMMQLLESRLDNIIFRLGLTTTRPQARQLVNHGHVLVNNIKVDIPSYQVRPDDVISLSSQASKFNFILENLEQKHSPPAWLERKATVGKVRRLPNSEESDTGVKYPLIIEFYSR